MPVIREENQESKVSLGYKGKTVSNNSKKRTALGPGHTSKFYCIP
jgi:hypothetical protein